MAVEIVLAPGTANEMVIPESEIIGQLNPVKTHTGLGDFAASIKPDTSVDAYAQRQDRININVDGTTVFTGFLHKSDRARRDADQSLSGPGIAKKLEETRPDYDAIGGPVTYSSIRLDDAIRDYWSRTPFDNFTVYDQSTTTIVTNKQIQSADTTTEWNDVTPIGGNEPFRVQNGELQVTQSCFTTEAENFDNSGGGIGTFSASRFSGSSVNDGVGQAMEFDANGEFVEIGFNLDYSIPDGNVELSIRYDGADATNQGSVEWILDGNNLGSFNIGTSDPQWRNLIAQGNISAPNGLSSGSHTLRIEATGSWSGGVFYVDIVAPNDNRYTYTFDNSLETASNGNRVLSGPELYPDAASIELLEVGTGYNISEATVNSTWNDTSNGQAIAVSNNGGADYQSSSNTSSITKSFSTEGREAKVKFTASRFGSGATSTPTTGFNGQTIDSFTLEVDGNDLVVIDKLELSRDHFSNLQTLHNYGDFVWSIDHTSDSIANIPVYSFLRGDQTQTSPPEFDDPIDEQSGIKAGRYYNVIYVQGAKNSGGSGPNGRPVAEAKADQSVIDNDGREITGFVRDQSITSKSGAVFRARALLTAAQSNSDLIGSKTITPVNLLPGFSYSVDFGNGPADKVLETVDLSYGESIESTAEFAFEEQIASEIKNLKAESRNLGNQV